MDMERFFVDLGERLETARRDDQHRYREFFDGLKPRLEAAKDLDQELNRHLAHRFNVFDYLRTNELGLSRVIADLLNPRANHGQGPFFLEILLAKLKLTERWLDLDLAGANVSVEHVITGQRRIDIHVKILGGDREYCLAIENKPYADDQENQVSDYLNHLARKFDDRFLLIYLSPTGKAPSDWSLPRSDLDQWTGRLAIMRFHVVQDGSEGAANDDGTIDAYKAFRESFSLTDWLNTCHDKSRVERLRWFLRDAQLFCQRTFGDHHMTTDSEARAVEDFLLSNSENLIVAMAVYDSWPIVRRRVCERFLEHLCRCIKQKVTKISADIAGEITVECKYRGDDRWRNRLWLYCDSWVQYSKRESDSNGRTSIRLEADGKAASGWLYGVSSPLPVGQMNEAEKDRRERLDTKLEQALALGGRTDRWPQRTRADNRMSNWNDLVPELQRECEARKGEITSYFVDAIVDVAVKAIPVVNEIEGSGV